MPERFSQIKESLRKPKPSLNTYIYPFEAQDPNKVETKNHHVSHSGPFKGAIDFIVPLETIILAAHSGQIIEVLDIHDQYGNDPKFAEFGNRITIAHPNGEFSQYIHLKQHSAKVKVGDLVIEGMPIGQTGNSGWMTEPHLHFFVFKPLPDKSFIGLKPKFKK